MPRPLALSITALGLLWVALGFEHALSQSIDTSPILEPSVLESLSGTYRYAGNAEQDHAKIQRSIEAAISDLGWLGRRVAAKRLANHKELPQRIVIAAKGDNVSITMGKYDAVAPSDGTKRELIAPNGRDSTLSYKLMPNEILQFFVFEHAKRKSTYRLNSDGQLVMSVYMTSEKLASPITYDLVYAREVR